MNKGLVKSLLSLNELLKYIYIVSYTEHHIEVAKVNNIRRVCPCVRELSAPQRNVPTLRVERSTCLTVHTNLMQHFRGRCSPEHYRFTYFTQ